MFVPTVLQIGPYRFYFYSHEPNEPPHIHVDRDKMTAKFWIRQVAVAVNLGFSKTELHELSKLVSKHQKQFLEKWQGYFGAEKG